MWQAVRRSLHPLWRRAPRLRSLALAAIDVAARPLFLPFRLDRPASRATQAQLEQQTDTLNAAAEYFAETGEIKLDPRWMAQYFRDCGLQGQFGQDLVAFSSLVQKALRTNPQGADWLASVYRTNIFRSAKRQPRV